MAMVYPGYSMVWWHLKSIRSLTERERCATSVIRSRSFDPIRNTTDHMIALDPPRKNRDVDVIFDLGSNSSGRTSIGPDPRNELNMSLHRPARPTRGRQRSPSAHEQRDLGLRFVYDRSIYPAAFVVDHVRPHSVAWEVATRGNSSFGVGSRLIGLNKRNILILQERQCSKVLQETVARVTFSSGAIEMRFDNIDLAQDLSSNGTDLNLWGKVAMSSNSRMSALARPQSAAHLSITSSTAGAIDTRRSKSQRKKDEWDPTRHGMKESKRKPRNQTRYGSTPVVGGAFTQEKRYKELEKVHTGTQANVSSFGKNVLSTSRTSPGFSIGLSTREDWRKVGFDGMQKPKDSGSSGQFSCFSGNKGTAGFGVSQRQMPPFKGLDPGFDSPGPAAYPEKYGMGPGSLSMAASASFGVSARRTIATDLGLDSPGPIYEPEDLDALGKEGRPCATFGIGPAHMPPGLNLSPFKNYDKNPIRM